MTQRRCRRARRISAPAARTIPPPSCREGMRAYAGIGCHYMVAVDGPLHAGLHPDGRRGRQLDRRGAVLETRRMCSRTSATAPTTTPAILAIRAAVAVRRQHHLQDPVQRRGRDDRRAAQRRRPHRADRSPARSRPKAPSASSSSPTSRTNIRTARDWPRGHHHPSSRRADGGAAASWPRSPASRC